jgi:hypothetical protein
MQTASSDALGKREGSQCERVQAREGDRKVELRRWILVVVRGRSRGKSSASAAAGRFRPNVASPHDERLRAS